MDGKDNWDKKFNRIKPAFEFCTKHLYFKGVTHLSVNHWCEREIRNEEVSLKKTHYYFQIYPCIAQ